MSSSLLTVQTADHKSIKARMKIGLGRAFSMLFQQRVTELSKFPSSYPTGLKDKMIMAMLKEQARIANNADFFERLHADFWRGEGGEVFSSNCDHRFEDLFLTRQAADLKLLQKYWSQSRLKHIVEIGCCSGLHLQHLVTKLPRVETAVGIDINPAQIQANIENSKFDPRIKFFAGDGGQWVIDNALPNTLFVTNGGVFEYFSQQRLTEIIRHVSSKLSPAMFFTVEPIAPDYSSAMTIDSIPFGEELSFSHNYVRLYQSNGFTVVHQRPVDFESWRLLTALALTKKTSGCDEAQLSEVNVSQCRTSQ